MGLLRFVAVCFEVLAEPFEADVADFAEDVAEVEKFVLECAVAWGDVRRGEGWVEAFLLWAMGEEVAVVVLAGLAKVGLSGFGAAEGAQDAEDDEVGGDEVDRPLPQGLNELADGLSQEPECGEQDVGGEVEGGELENGANQ